MAKFIGLTSRGQTASPKKYRRRVDHPIRLCYNLAWNVKEGAEAAPRKDQPVPRWPKATYFSKPRHPRFNWTRFNQAKHEKARNLAILHDEHVREGRKVKGFKSLKGHRAKERFGNLPPTERPQAEREFNRLYLAYIARHGHPPPPKKVYSLMANASWIVRHVRSGHSMFWVRSHRVYRRLLEQEDSKREREGTPAEAPLHPVARSSWNLQGI